MPDNNYKDYNYSHKNVLEKERSDWEMIVEQWLSDS